MPQATEELRNEWRGPSPDYAEGYLEGRGFVLRDDFAWEWRGRMADVTDKDRSAVEYMIQEWDYCGLVVVEPGRPQRCTCGWSTYHVENAPWASSHQRVHHAACPVHGEPPEGPPRSGTPVSTLPIGPDGFQVPPPPSKRLDWDIKGPIPWGKKYPDVD